MPQIASLFDPRPACETTEQFLSLLQKPGFRLETIVSHGRASEPGFWYDQKDAEWVLLARGRAVLQFENQKPCDLRAGDYLLIPAHCKHRVSCCSDDAVWLALHFSDSQAGI